MYYIELNAIDLIINKTNAILKHRRRNDTRKLINNAVPLARSRKASYLQLITRSPSTRLADIARGRLMTCLVSVYIT